LYLPVKILQFASEVAAKSESGSFTSIPSKNRRTSKSYFLLTITLLISTRKNRECHKYAKPQYAKHTLYRNPCFVSQYAHNYLNYTYYFTYFMIWYCIHIQNERNKKRYFGGRVNVVRQDIYTTTALQLFNSNQL